ncbi:DNA polymerase III subunit delta' [Klebsiella pneumoniae]|uniref:DNA-directed DNA polymerase n=1 Tax=Klebsiella pneumoniae TaxID=573 RepID=A0A377TPW4_KLEPN|nr:DNA polymerase III subunit delta' [Klebsiella pneumoniae]
MVWISDAALLTDAAANALLKTLEEPPENTWFFLACEEPARLLTTLRSRCRLHHLAPPSEPYALAWLEREVSLPQESLLTALRLCASAPAAALELLQEPLWTARSSCVRRWRYPGER